MRERFADLRKRIKTDSPLIVDAGAHTGSIVDLFLHQYHSPIIHVFEPIPELVKGLKDKYSNNKNVVIHEKALGAETTVVSFNILNNIVSSSILKPSKIKKKYHGTNVDVKEVIQVQQTRLDEILDEDIDILKLDLQGYELEALKGCSRLFGRIKTIITEVEFVPLYEGQALFGDIDVFLRECGFRLLNLYELFTQSDGQLTAGDALYLNERYFQ